MNRWINKRYKQKKSTVVLHSPWIVQSNWCDGIYEALSKEIQSRHPSKSILSISVWSRESQWTCETAWKQSARGTTWLDHSPCTRQSLCLCCYNWETIFCTACSLILNSMWLFDCCSPIGGLYEKGRLEAPLLRYDDLVFSINRHIDCMVNITIHEIEWPWMSS